MKAFMDEDFLLETETAKKLFHEHAAKMPIIDYHCHINPQQIAENYQFRNITDAWLSGDHYKWRMIRSNGVPEKLITAMKVLIMKNLRCSPNHCRALSVILCITGPTLNSSAISALLKLFPKEPAKKFGMNAMLNLPLMISEFNPSLKNQMLN